MSTTPQIGMTYLDTGQSNNLLRHNENLEFIEALLVGGIVNRTTTAPPAATNGDAYIIAATATGDWTGKEKQIAIYYQSQWRYILPKEGMRVWDKLQNASLHYDGTAWTAKTGESLFAGQDAAGGQTITTWVGVMWDTETRKETGVYTHSTSSDKDQITILEAGTYLVQADVGMAASGSAGYNTLSARLTINGSLVANTLAEGHVHVSNTPNLQLSISALITVAVNDILRLEVQRGAGSSTIATRAGYSRITVAKK